jgi:hypothetical protein
MRGSDRYLKLQAMEAGFLFADSLRKDSSGGAFWKFVSLGNVDQERFKESSVARAVPHAARTLDGKALRRSSGSAGRKILLEESN